MPKIASIWKVGALPLLVLCFYPGSNASLSSQPTPSRLRPPGASATVIDPAATAPLRVQLDGIQKGALVTLLMRDVMRMPYLISSDVLQDRSPVSVNLIIPRSKIPETVARFLRQLGLSVEVQGGTVLISRTGAGMARPAATLPGQIYPSGSAPGQSPAALPGQVYSGPSAPPAPVFSPRLIAVLSPSHRPPLEFVDPLASALPAVSVAARPSSVPQGDAILPFAAPDQLVISGAPDLVERALELVAKLDVPRPSVTLSVLILEVRTDQARGSALQVLSDALSASVAPSSYSGLPVLPQSLSLTVGGITAIASAVREDSRISILSQPSIQVESGSAAVLNAGSQVPTLGAVTFAQGAEAPVQSVEYRPSGIVLEVLPTVRAGLVHLALKQERSSFSQTTTGVNSSPTLDQTALNTSLVIKPGSTVALAGVSEKTRTNSKRGIFGGLVGVRSNSSGSRQIVIVIQADIDTIETIVPADPVLIGPFDAPASASGSAYSPTVQSTPPPQSGIVEPPAAEA